MANNKNNDEWILHNAVDIGYLSEWYISSISSEDTPVWTSEHISELIGDFYCIPKEALNKL